MLKIETLTLGQLQTNCYLVYCDQTHEGIIIDPADEGQYIIQKIQELKFKPLAIIATHAHFDHILASLELKLAFQIPFLIHPKDKFLLKQTQTSAKHWLGINVDPPAPPDKYLKENQKINFGNQKLYTIETPGHTPGGISLYSQKENTIFTGDTIFAHGSIGRHDFSYSSESNLYQSISKILKYPDQTKIYPGHGPSSTIGKEKKIHLPS